MLQADKIQLYSKKQNKTDIALNEKYKSMMLNGHNQRFFQFGYTHQLLNHMKALLDFFVMFDDENMIILIQRRVLI